MFLMKNKNILFYGNCQISIVDLIRDSLKEYNIKFLPCWNSSIEREEFLNIVRESDIIITQPVKNNYRNKDYLSTEFLLENSKKETKVIIFPSLRLDFYYFDFYYQRLKNNEQLTEPGDCHYKSLIHSYKENKPIEYFLSEYLDNKSLKSNEELDQIVDSSIKELEKREALMLNFKRIKECFIINSSEYIRKNFKKQLLFYSANHPTKYLLQHIAKNITECLDFNEEIKNVDPLYNNERGMLYGCIQNYVEFDILEHKPYLSKYKIEDAKEICKKYYEVYDKINLKEKI